MIDYIISTVFILFGYIVFCALTNAIFSDLFNTTIKIELPKNKKWDGKVDPIYEIKRSNWDYSLIVTKWELGYKIDAGIEALCFFFLPYSIKFLQYRYWQNEDTFPIGSGNECDLKQITDLKTFYEETSAIQKEEYEKAKQIKNTKQSLIDNLNKTFTENYEKS